MDIITVDDVPGWIAAGMTPAEIMAERSDLTGEDIRACVAFDFESASIGGNDGMP
jgi:uncharacterized protein (DUF433 family)